jgi:hypothetical protein
MKADVINTAVPESGERRPRRDVHEAAFATLGLSPQADAGLVEIAYWCQVELCHTAGLEGREWRRRLSELNEARARLVALACALPKPRTPLPSVQAPSPHLVGWAVVAALCVPAAGAAGAALGVVMFGIWGATAIGVIGGSVVLGAVLGAGLYVRTPLRQPPFEVTNEDALQCLRLAPDAPPALVSLSHQYLRGRALAEGDLDGKFVLDAAVQAITRELFARDAAGRGEETGSAMDRDDTASVQLSSPPQSHVEGASDRTGPEAHDAMAGPRAVFTPAPDAAATIAGCLKISTDGGDDSRELPLIDGHTYTIGSSHSANIRLAAPSVAAEHARLTVRRGRVLFHHVAPDAVSLVNNSEANWAVIEPGDELLIGVFRCRFTTDPVGQGSHAVETTGVAIRDCADGALAPRRDSPSLHRPTEM